MDKPIPILFLSDAPDARGGLSRITRDVAGQLSASPRYRVGVLGRGAVGSHRLPFPTYAIRQLQGNEWGAYDLRRVWEDFASHERGVVMTIWDPIRTLWLSRPENCPDQEVAEWLRQGHFDLWGYFPIDATGPGDRLSLLQRESLMGYRRVLAYTRWAQELIARSLGQPEASKRHLTWLPHGLDWRKWQAEDRDAAKGRLFPFLHEGDGLVGVNMTNQPRKDWGLAATTCGLLGQRHPRLKFWWHTDLLERYWSLNALVADLGLAGKVHATVEKTDEELRWLYNACDLTMLPSLGEGFGYPLFESLACGVPVLHGDYAGGADVMRQCGWEDFLLSPETYRLDGSANQIRPAFNPLEWANRAEVVMEESYDRNVLRASVAHLAWQPNLWPSCWQRWFDEAADEWEAVR